MRLRSLISTLALASVIAVPAGAQDRERHRSNDDHQRSSDHARARQQPQAEQRQQPQAQQRQQPQAQQRQQPQAEQRQQRQAQPRQQAERQQADQARRQQAQPQQVQPRREQVGPQQPRELAVPRQDRSPAYRGNDNRASSNNRAYNNNYGRNDVRRWDNRRYESYVSGVHRYNAYVIHPQVIRVIPYRPYVYRPSFSIGIYYGADGYYPYGYTPDYYFNPIPGRLYGGVRITGAPRDAQVFADGYYVGIVDDFDGIFQHINLEAGPHHIEIAWGGYQPIAFDVYVRPGETTTFRADGNFRY
jgi:hypothetical protein